jgi:hypothetical protein
MSEFFVYPEDLSDNENTTIETLHTPKKVEQPENTKTSVNNVFKTDSKIKQTTGS